MKWFLWRVVALLLWPFGFVGGTLVWIVSKLFGFLKQMGAMLAQLIIGSVAIMIPVALILIVIFGLLYFSATALDGLW